MATSTGSVQTVAVLDTGIDGSHPELSARVVGCFNALPKGKSCSDDNGHGTYVAGIIAAGRDDRGVIGAAPLSKLVAVKVLDQNGAGRSSDTINGMQYAYSKGYRVLNMSLGFPESTVPLEKAVQRLYRRGMIMIASVGNTNPRPGAAGEGGDGEGGDTSCETQAAGEGGDGEGGDADGFCYQTTNVKFPAAYHEVIGVAATTIDDEVANYSRAGPVNIAAPGGSQERGLILSTNKGGGYGEASGTSGAAAHVTGTVALALQLRPKLTFEQILTLLQGTAWKLDEPTELQGAGLADAKGMIEALP
jgi:subtilisin family serine protease